MSPTAGALATVAFVDNEDDLLWVRYANGNAGFLDPHDGPDVEVGSILLVSLEDGSFVEAPIEVFPRGSETGSLATVVLAAPGETYWVRYTGGGYGPLHRDGGPEVAIGAVILVSGSTFVRAPDGLLPPPKNGIGVVRRVEETRSLVETDHSLLWLPHEGVIDWKEWSTVELSETGIVKELDERPLRYRDDPPAATAVHSRFRVDPSKVTETFDGIEGLDGQIAELRQIIEMMHNTEALKEKGMLPIRGLLLAGESGTGKTMLARALANEANAVYFHVRGPEIASKWVNESEEMLRALMDEADSLDRAVVFFDEIDSLGGARSSTAHEMSNKLITQFLALLDGFDEKPGRALIVGATNRPDALDPTMLRSGRFDRRIDFELPTIDAREAILQATSPKDLAEDIDVRRLATLTETWCSADLRALWTRAFQFARSEGRKQILDLDCEVAIERIARQVLARRTQIARI
ncbi:26S protease regulatory subunit [Phytoactinopolyspora alkaliphila]|uniref:26S protease regulatory subunit n=1 Tax=Phytoactinopolyspora alkaliphila TaxID=1783498 RepID=A0A6N9YPD5_9ACTN|nr:AAA family ATPase [Phytoactinopolyspora alkaliphila]NED96834.1 26S protease regulatory subunit [Phytoactinopolyspora alkaliphila]